MNDNSNLINTKSGTDISSIALSKLSKHPKIISNSYCLKLANDFKMSYKRMEAIVRAIQQGILQTPAVDCSTSSKTTGTVVKVDKPPVTGNCIFPNLYKKAVKRPQIPNPKRVEKFAKGEGLLLKLSDIQQEPEAKALLSLAQKWRAQPESKELLRCFDTLVPTGDVRDNVKLLSSKVFRENQWTELNYVNTVNELNKSPPLQVVYKKKEGKGKQRGTILKEAIVTSDESILGHEAEKKVRRQKKVETTEDKSQCESAVNRFLSKTTISKPKVDAGKEAEEKWKNRQHKNYERCVEMLAKDPKAYKTMDYKKLYDDTDPIQKKDLPQPKLGVFQGIFA